ncbi:hypothetical protein [Actinoplanes derwentensis]|uniref:hypothetical protein n=1 Tax=Actinoplanes derwentensis TaxID=113562 RepID=UPI0018D2C6F0|nr:hypothetical protein [Actinoplanes derwentensis]
MARFLYEHLNARVSADSWERAIQVPWKVEAPNHGFLLRDEQDEIAGVYLAFYSERDGRRICNLGAWCVLPQHRFHSLKLLKALLSQEGHVFTDLSPSGTVVPMNTRLGFRFVDTATALAPNLPWPSAPGRLSTDPAALESTLRGADLQIYRDHATAAAARQVMLTHRGRYCHVIYRTDRRKGLPLFASLLHVSDPGLFRVLRRRFQSHLLLRHGIPALLAEIRVAGHRPRLSRMLPDTRRKMYRGDLAERDVDYLYSELTCLSW